MSHPDATDDHRRRGIGAPVRFAVVGAGHIAQHAALPAFAHARRDAALTAIFSGSARKRAELARMYDVETFSYDDFGFACRAGIFDAVYIALPNTMHRDFAVRAAEAGIHVLCEKPMATSVVDCRAMRRAAQDADIRFMIAYRLHFEPANMRAVEIVRSGRIGRPRYFHSAFSMQVRADNIRVKREAGGGPLLDLGVYCVNAARYLLGGNPVEVFAFAASGGDSRFDEVEEAVAATLKFSGGVTASFTCSFGAADASWFQVVGEKGDVCLDHAFEYEGPRELSVTVDNRTRVSTFAPRDQFAPELVYFARCVRDRTDPEPGSLEGLADVTIIEALYKSIRISKRVALGELPDDVRPGPQQVITRPPARSPKLVGARSAHAP